MTRERYLKTGKAREEIRPLTASREGGVSNSTLGVARASFGPPRAGYALDQSEALRESPCPEEAELAFFPGLPESPGMERTKKTAPTEVVGRRMDGGLRVVIASLAKAPLVVGSNKARKQGKDKPWKL